MVRKFEYRNRIEYKNENGDIHRKNGPAVIRSNGREKWYINGKLHREDGPAVITENGNQFWFKNDRIHREDGPAVIRPNGEVDWCLDGHIYSFKKWCEVVNISDEEKMELVLRYG